MPASPDNARGSRPVLGVRNLVVLAAGAVSVGLGFVLLDGGGTTVAAAFLVLGYCILFPIGIAL